MTEPFTVDPEQVIEYLFQTAKEEDEFEYCSTLLRIRGMEEAGWDPLHESQQLAHQLLAVAEAPIEQSLRLRLHLFLYCHLTEMFDTYHIPANMLRVCMGERYVMNPFGKEFHASNKPARYPTEKASRIKEWADSLQQLDLGAMFQEMLVKEVRNAFYHSDYILTPNSFNIRRGRGVHIGNEITTQVPYEWLFPRINLGIGLALAILNLTVAHMRSYKEDKVVQGRITSDGSYSDIQLTVDKDHGLSGFKSPPDKGLRTQS